MIISSDFQVTLRANGDFWVVSPNHPNGKLFPHTDAELCTTINHIYSTMRSVNFSDRTSALQNYLKAHSYMEEDAPFVFLTNECGIQLDSNSAPENTPTVRTIDCVGVMQKFMNFFSEFSFCPSFRFMNTLCRHTCESVEKGIEYIRNYVLLSDDSYKNEICEKIKSKEFVQLMETFHLFKKPTNTVNNRLKIYFGSQGTGKTTKAQEETNNRCMVCNSSMLPSDLMEDFDFVGGSPVFKKSILWNAMEQGLPVVLDEINLLPFDSLRFLQGITDGKSDFAYKNKPVHIADGFCIIGTMNLSLGGMTYGLPIPLVDRCAEIKEYVLTPEQLLKSVMETGTSFTVGDEPTAEEAEELPSN